MCQRSPLAAALIAYLGIAVSMARPISDSQSPTIEAPAACLSELKPEETSGCTSMRYYYDSLNNTCTLTHVCSSEFNITYQTVEECSQACIEVVNATVEEAGFQECTLPHLNNGISHSVDCEEIQCTVYYSCNKPYELFPKENRGKRFQCTQGTWEEHNVYCARVNVEVSINGVKTNTAVDAITVNKSQAVVLSCKVDNIDPSEYNSTWSFNNKVLQTAEGVNEITISSVGDSDGGVYTCSVSGKIDVSTEVKLQVEKSADNPGAPEILQTDVNVNQNLLTGVCICKGSPKPELVWKIGDNVYGNAVGGLPDHSYVFLHHVVPSPGVYNVSCQCYNDHGFTSRSWKLETTAAGAGKKKRSVPLRSCQLGHETAIVTGKILRHTKSTTHVKINDVLATHDSIESDLSAKPIIRIDSSHRNLARNQLYTLKVQKTGPQQYAILSTVPHDPSITDISSYC